MFICEKRAARRVYSMLYCSITVKSHYAKRVTKVALKFSSGDKSRSLTMLMKRQVTLRYEKVGAILSRNLFLMLIFTVTRFQYFPEKSSILLIPLESALMQETDC